MSGKRLTTTIATRVSACVETSVVPSLIRQTAVSLSRRNASDRPLVIHSSSSSPRASFPFARSSSFHTSARDFPRFDSKKKADQIRVTEKRSKYEPVDLKTSVSYLKSEAFAITYEGLPIWHPTLYRRNFRGPYNPTNTRPDCVIHGRLCSNPCPICRDDHLLVHHENLELLKQFVEPQSGNVISHRKTNVCLLQQSRVEIAIGRARDRGLLETRVPHRDYDYADFYSKDLLEECHYEDILSPAEKAFLARTKDVAERQLGRNDIVIEDAYSVEADDDDGSDSDREAIR